MFRSFVAAKPLQTGKLVGILLVLLLGFLGFFRILSADAVIDNPALADGQFLAIVFVPLLGLALVCVVVLETLVSGYRAVRSERPIREQLAARPGYVVLRTAEAAVALFGLALLGLALPVLLSESLPAPAGVGLMLGLLVVGLAILVAGFVRALFELYVHARRNRFAGAADRR